MAGWTSDPAPIVKRHDRGIRARSYPPAGKLTPPVVDDWLHLAPLASPETLSESSSLASCGGAGVAGQRVTSAAILPLRMDPILQSPARSTSNSHHDDSCGLYVESSASAATNRGSCVEKLPTPRGSDVDKPATPRAPCVERSASRRAAGGHHGPDVVPAEPPQHAGTGVATSSVDVIHDTRSTDLHSSEDQQQQPHTRGAVDGGTCCTPSDELPTRRRDHTSSGTPSRSCERGACVCGCLTPDVVSTHDCRGAAMLNVLSADEA